jgi:hypothetical protein
MLDDGGYGRDWEFCFQPMTKEWKCGSPSSWNQAIAATEPAIEGIWAPYVAFPGVYAAFRFHTAPAD